VVWSRRSACDIIGGWPRLAWLSQYRRLRVRYEQRVAPHEALVRLGGALNMDDGTQVMLEALRCSTLASTVTNRSLPT